jgi:protein disulfide-isomerase A6
MLNADLDIPPLPTSPFLLFSQWCGHCKSLAPEYVKVSDTFASSKSSVLIAKVNADAAKELAGQFEVAGFPTLKWFPGGGAKPEDYEGGRTAEDLIAFVNSKTGLSRKLKAVPSDVDALTPETFDAVVSQPDTFKLLEFYAPWCGHCKALAPVYEQLGAAFAGEPRVVIAKVDADAHRELGERFGVSGFPTIKYVARDATGKADASAPTYEGGRDLETLVEFVNKQAGTARRSDGSLLQTAGRVAALDALASGFTGSPSTLASAKAAAAALVSSSDVTSAALYLRAFDKVAEKGAAYIPKEIKRLDGMLADEGVSKAKKGEIALRRNVLAAFISTAAGEEDAADL